MTGQIKNVNFKISVIDSGNGITEEGHENIFVDFGKLDENAS